MEIKKPGGFTNIRSRAGVDIFKAAYLNRLIGIAPGGLIGYWPMDETAGIVSNDYSGRANPGAYTGVTLNDAVGPDGRGTPRFDGINDYNNIYSAPFNADFDGDHGSVIVWCKIINVGPWTDGTIDYVVNLASLTAGNSIQIEKPAGNNIFRITRSANAVVKKHEEATNTTDWFSAAITWDTTADEAKYYFNGVLRSTLNTINNWTGNLRNDRTIIGSFSTGGARWNGWLAHCAVWNRVLSEDDIASITRV